MKEATLPIMILTRLGQTLTPLNLRGQGSQETDNSDAEMNTPTRISMMDLGSNITMKSDDGAESLVFKCFIDILYQCNITPEVIAQVVVPVFNRYII